jgi:EmrB/QacA subfamily drug resistance transporter
MSSPTATVPHDSFHYAKRRLGLAVIGLSVLVLSLDNSILNTALPSIARDLNAGTTELQWIVDGYVLVFASLLLTMGNLGDRVGRKRALQSGLMLFGLISLAAALSPTTLALTAARMLLGVAGALMLPATLSIVTATFPPEERPQAIATWASLFALGVVIGPMLGGFLVQVFSWHAAFLVNLPVTVAAVALGHIYLGETREPQAPPPDVAGALLSILGLLALVYGIIEAGVVGWTAPNVAGALLAAAVVLGLFAAWEARTPHPMLPLAFFRSRTFTGANLTLTLVTFCLFGVIFFIPQFLQLILGHSAFESGVLLLPLALTLTFTASRSARVARRLGTRRTVALGVSIAGTAFLYMALAYRVDTTYFPVVLIGQLGQAGGLGLAISPATNAIMASVPVAKAGVGSAMNDTNRQLGGALGVAVFGTIAMRAYLAGVEPLRGALSPAAFQQVAAGLPAVVSLATRQLMDAALYAQVVPVARAAFIAGLRQTFFVGAAIMYAAAALALQMLPDVVRGEREARAAHEAGEPHGAQPLPAEGKD